MIRRKRVLRSRLSSSHPEGWARRCTTLKRLLARVLLHSAVSGPRFSVGTTTGVVTLLLSALPPVRLSAQSVDPLALRFTSMTAVTGLEQSMADSLRALFPGSTRDRVGNVTLTLGQGSPKRLCTCPLDEVGYVVDNILRCSISSSRATASVSSGRKVRCPAWSP